MDRPSRALSPFRLTPAALLLVVIAAAVPQLGSSCTSTVPVEVRDADTGQLIPAKISVFNPDTGASMGLASGSGGNLALVFANRIYLGGGQGQIVLPTGRYDLWASRGIEYTIDHRVVDLSTTTSISFALSRVVDTTGYLSADFHIHARPSFESVLDPGGLPSLPDRVVHFVTEGIEVMGSSDHDCVVDYAPSIASLGLGGAVTSIVGVEATPGVNAFPDGHGNCDQLGPTGPPGSETGHWNAFPISPAVTYDTTADSGATVSAATIYDMLRGFGGPATLVQLNHPYFTSNIGNIGWFDQSRFDPTVPVPPVWPGSTTPKNAFLRRPSVVPGSPTQGLDFDAMELWAGGSVVQGRPTRAAWWSLLSQGFLKIATANSDSHQQDMTAGFPRNLVWLGTDDPTQVTPEQVAGAVRAGKVVGTTGPVPSIRVAGVGMGELATTTDGTVTVELSVQAAPWVPVDEVRLIVNGQVARTISLTPAPDPAPVLRYSGTETLALTRDAWIVVEAGAALPADPTQEPPVPPAYAKVAPGFSPLSFTNPVFVDVDGNGRFDAPGL